MDRESEILTLQPVNRLTSQPTSLFRECQHISEWPLDCSLSLLCSAHRIVGSHIVSSPSENNVPVAASRRTAYMCLCQCANPRLWLFDLPGKHPGEAQAFQASIVQTFCDPSFSAQVLCSHRPPTSPACIDGMQIDSLRNVPVFVRQYVM